MSYTYLKAGAARLLVLAMEHDFPDRVEVWRKELAQNRLTTEMRSVFEAMGYEVPRVRADNVPIHGSRTVEEAHEGMHPTETIGDNPLTRAAMVVALKDLARARGEK